MIHVVSGNFPTGSYNARDRVYKSLVIDYTCSLCPFRGTLEQGVIHAHENQFTVKEPPKK